MILKRVNLKRNLISQNVRRCTQAMDSEAGLAKLISRWGVDQPFVFILFWLLDTFGDTGDKGDWCWGPTRVRWGHWLAIHEFKEDFVNNQRPTALAEILLLGGVRLGLNSRGCCVSTPLETFLCPATFIHTCQLKVPKNSGLLWVKVVYWGQICPIFTWVCFLIMICFAEQNILFGLLLAFFLDSRSSCAGNSSHMALCWKLGCNQTFCRCKRSILFFRSIALLSVSWLNYMPAHKS